MLNLCHSISWTILAYTPTFNWSRTIGAIPPTYTGSTSDVSNSTSASRATLYDVTSTTVTEVKPISSVTIPSSAASGVKVVVHQLLQASLYLHQLFLDVTPSSSTVYDVTSLSRQLLLASNHRL